MAIAMDNSSLLLYRVGPVLCCAPTLPINSIIPPPPLAHPPGTDAAKPGIFKHAGHIAASIDLRYKFGVEQEHWSHSSKVIVTEIEPGQVGFWVDEIIDVMGFPTSGWARTGWFLGR
jgi:purine-binding chemotaxis protein CheW